MHRKTKRTQYSAPPTHCAYPLAHRQSQRPFSWHTTNQRIQWLRRPMAQMSDGPPPQTSHAQSEPTTSARLWKRPTQLNTPNIFVPDLARVSQTPNVQWLGRDVPALKGRFNIPSFPKINMWCDVKHKVGHEQWRTTYASEEMWRHLIDLLNYRPVAHILASLIKHTPMLNPHY